MAHTTVATRVLREAHLNAAINVDGGHDSWTWLRQLTEVKLRELRQSRDYELREGIQK